jgi:transposase
MREGVAVGVDVAKDFHWVRAVARRDSEVVFSGRVDNTPPVLAAFVERLEDLRARGPLTVGIDVVGGIAGVLTAMLLEAGVEVVPVPGLAVNRARQGTAGGEHKSDPRDAAVIAEQVRHRRDLRAIEPVGELDAEIRLLVARRRELVTDQTRRISRLRDLLVSIHPGLERIVDPTTKAGQQLLSRYVTPAEIRKAGRRRLAEHILRAGRIARRHADELADHALAAAREQTLAVPGERVAADLVRELAVEAAHTRSRLCALDRELQAALARHPDAALIQSLPGMGVTLAAEFIAEAGNIERFATPDKLAAAAGLAPVLKQSGKVRYLKRAHGGNKALKRVFFQSAFCSLSHPDSKAFYRRKRAERKTHHQAVLALAPPPRRRPPRDPPQPHPIRAPPRQGCLTHALGSLTFDRGQRLDATPGWRGRLPRPRTFRLHDRRRGHRMAVEPLLEVLRRDPVDRCPGRMERSEVTAAYRPQDCVVAEARQLRTSLRRQRAREDDGPCRRLGSSRIRHMSLPPSGLSRGGCCAISRAA